MLEPLTKKILHSESYSVKEVGAENEVLIEDSESLKRKNSVHFSPSVDVLSSAEDKRKSKKRKLACALAFTLVSLSLLVALSIILFPSKQKSLNAYDMTLLASNCTEAKANQRQLDEFDLFVTGFAPIYKTFSDSCRALTAFVDNEAIVAEYNFNSSHDKAMFSVTLFSDWDEEKRKTQVLDFSTQEKLHTLQFESTNSNATVDWSIETSFKEILDGMRTGCANKWWLTVEALRQIQFEIRNKSSIVPEVRRAPNFSCPNLSNMDEFPPILSSDVSIFSLDEENETVLQNFVANRGPLIIGFCVPPSLFDYSSGIFSYDQCEGNVFGFLPAIVVGFGKENNKDYWKIAGWWGTQWGESGFFRVEKGSNSCGIGTLDTFAIDENPVQMV